ncbi:MAG: hypothetical protein QCI38_01360, partial [Candidatus Thermoplasmatota archaeon]|nr:hypothetical protein [Candidatus Thermoplasmatota archaeon]
QGNKIPAGKPSPSSQVKKDVPPEDAVGDKQTDGKAMNADADGPDTKANAPEADDDAPYTEADAHDAAFNEETPPSDDTDVLETSPKKDETGQKGGGW